MVSLKNWNPQTEIHLERSIFFISQGKVLQSRGVMVTITHQFSIDSLMHVDVLLLCPSARAFIVESPRYLATGNMVKVLLSSKGVLVMVCYN